MSFTERFQVWRGSWPTQECDGGGWLIGAHDERDAAEKVVELYVVVPEIIA